MTHLSRFLPVGAVRSARQHLPQEVNSQAPPAAFYNHSLWPFTRPAATDTGASDAGSRPFPELLSPEEYSALPQDLPPTRSRTHTGAASKTLTEAAWLVAAGYVVILAGWSGDWAYAEFLALLSNWAAGGL